MEQMAAEKIAELIVTKLVERSRRLLLVYSGSPLELDVVHAQLRRLADEGFHFSVFATVAARQILDMKKICRELGVDDYQPDGENYKAFLQKGSAIVIPTLTQNSAAKIALGINDTPFCNIVSGGLMRGYEVIASTEGCCPESPSRVKLGMNQMTPAYFAMMRGHLETLQSYGVRLTLPGNIYNKIKEATKLRMVKTKDITGERRPAGCAPPPEAPWQPRKAQIVVSPSPHRREVYALSQVIMNTKDGVLSLPEDALLTPSAKEYIRDNQLKIVRRE